MRRRLMYLFNFVLLLTILHRGIAYGIDINTDPSLVGWWKLDDGSGTIAVDSSSRGNNGTFVDAPQWVVGYRGSGLYLDGSSAVEIATPLNLNSNNVTITAWVKRNGEQASWAAFVFTRAGGSVAGIGHSESIELRYHWNNATWAFSSGLEPPDNEWFFAALVIEPTQGTIYMNEQTAVNVTAHAIEEFDGALYIGQDPQGGRFFDGTIDEVAIFNRSLTQEEINNVMIGVPPTLASDPIPANEATDITRDVVLSWTPGISAQTHDVYLGTTLDDVSNAEADSPLLIGPAQDVNTYNAGRLGFGQTYFWRVDEVNAPPDSTVYKGSIWSFTVETYMYSIDAEDIIATASSSAVGQGPENTINRLGLVGNLHSKEIEDMWLSGPEQPGAAWIQYEFDKPYKLHEMLVWNYNAEDILTFYGLWEVKIEYSTDANTWAQLDNVPEFAPAPGMANYAYNTNVPFDGVPAKYVRITAHSNLSMGLLDQYGLSEVMFMYIPVSAREPEPNDGATDVAIDATLSWRPGREADEHKIYLSDNEQSIIDGTAPVTIVNQASYNTPTLDLSSIYYWRIDEVNNTETPASWQSNIWSFSTQEYVSVDDFESYNDIEVGQNGSNLVYSTWKDGLDNPSTNGSIIGYFEAFQPTMESGIVHSDGQSVPLMYDNSVASLSEVTANTVDLSIGQDWTKGDAQTFILWFFGDPNNSATERMYVKINTNKVIYDGDSDNLTKRRWTQWNIDLVSLGINLNNVTTLSIGFEKTGATGGSGTVLIDDIRLYRLAPPIPTPVDPGTDDLVAYYMFENNSDDSSGNGLNGTIAGNPIYIQSLAGYGMALQLDGVDDYVNCGNSTSLDITEEITLSAWVKTSDAGNDENNPFVTKGDHTYAIKHTDDNEIQFYIYDGDWFSANVNVDSSFNGDWRFVAGTYDGNEVKAYVDGGLRAVIAHAGTIEVRTNDLIIGANSEASDRFYNGAIDDVRIYNRALSEGEILYLADN